MCLYVPCRFNPRTRKEISEIRWHPVSELPTQPKQKRGYYMVYPFVRYIRKFINARREAQGQRELMGIGHSHVIFFADDVT